MKKNTTQRRAKSSDKKKGVETGRRAPKVVSTKVKAQSRPRIERASKDEVVEHNRLVPRSNRGCPIPSFLGKKLPKPYSKYIATAIFLFNNRRGKRRTVALRHIITGSVKAVSYARFVYQIAHGISLKEMHVDHIDNNPLNDRLKNLQPLSLLKNAQKAARARGLRKAFDVTCYICGKLFTIAKNQTYLGGGRKPLPTCSRSCGGSLTHKSLSTKQKKKIFKSLIVKEYRTNAFHSKL